MNRSSRIVRALRRLPFAVRRSPFVVCLLPFIASAQSPLTRAEQSKYTVTSSHADVVAFLDSLKQRAPGKVFVGSIGKTMQGRELVYAIASRPLVTTPAAAKALHRPIVYIEGNIHSGEVEGKEALQAILRDLVLDPKRNVLDSIVLIALPDYNADGNDNTAPQARNRGSQNGPEMVGTRPNAMGLNLNRDYVKAETPETRASLAMFNAWDPDVFIDGTYIADQLYPIPTPWQKVPYDWKARLVTGMQWERFEP